MFLEEAIKYIKGEWNIKNMLLHADRLDSIDEEHLKRIAVEKAALEYALEVLQKGDE